MAIYKTNGLSDRSALIAIVLLEIAIILSGSIIIPLAERSGSLLPTKSLTEICMYEDTSQNIQWLVRGVLIQSKAAPGSQPKDERVPPPSPSASGGGGEGGEDSENVIKRVVAYIAILIGFALVVSFLLGVIVKCFRWRYVGVVGETLSASFLYTGFGGFFLSFLFGHTMGLIVTWMAAHLLMSVGLFVLFFILIVIMVRAIDSLG